MLRWLRRLALDMLAGAGLVTLAFVALVVATPQPAPRPASRKPAAIEAARTARQRAAAPIRAGCDAPLEFTVASAFNAASLRSASWSPFKRAESGWETYAPLVGQTIGTQCAPESAGFSAALARWRGQAGRPAAGRLDAPTLQAMGADWLRRRPFVRAMSGGRCPEPPAAGSVALARPAEGYGSKRVSLRADALAAFRRLRDAARSELAEAAKDTQVLTLVSGYRDPVEEAARCARRACDGLTRARCSAHRTGLAMDVYLGEAAGGDPTSSDDANRLRQSRSPAYRWLVRNAGRFGFMPYPFEPWHWEWEGSAA